MLDHHSVAKNRCICTDTLHVQKLSAPCVWHECDINDI